MFTGPLDCQKHLPESVEDPSSHHWCKRTPLRHVILNNHGFLQPRSVFRQYEELEELKTVIY